MPLESIGELDENDALSRPSLASCHAFHRQRCPRLRQAAVDGPFAGIKNPKVCNKRVKSPGRWASTANGVFTPAKSKPVNQTFVPSEKELSWAQTGAE
jgi:citrate lyase beta subunit